MSTDATYPRITLDMLAEMGQSHDREDIPHLIAEIRSLWTAQNADRQAQDMYERLLLDYQEAMRAHLGIMDACLKYCDDWPPDLNLRLQASIGTIQSFSERISDAEKKNRQASKDSSRDEEGAI